MMCDGGMPSSAFCIFSETPQVNAFSKFPDSPTQTLKSASNYHFQKASNLKFCVNFLTDPIECEERTSPKTICLTSRRKSINAAANLCLRKAESGNGAPDPDL